LNSDPNTEIGLKDIFEKTSKKMEVIMALIQTVDPEKAEGEVKEIYDALKANIGMVPSPMELASASPWMMKGMWQSIQYFTQHPNLGFGVLSTIRYLVAEEYDYAFCINFNKNFLKMQGMTDEDIEKTSRDPSQAPLDDKDRALVAFVMDAIKKPNDATQADVDGLHDLGWTDNDILDAMSHAASMVSASILMKTFKMDIAC
jgi:alkylhydroperoxidase/carboxymuconolactone decarboxylase family protein YurZ